MTKNTLKEVYLKEIVPALKKDLGIKNTLSVPKVKKIKINVGIGSYISNNGKSTREAPAEIIKNIAAISGQKPMVNLAKNAISNFKIREGMPVGVSVTLNGDRMYDFLNKLINIVLPRVRDFRGIPKKVLDGQGNLSFGLKEHLMFPEINQDDMEKPHGIQITITTTAKTDQEGYMLLTGFNFPFKENKKEAPKKK